MRLSIWMSGCLVVISCLLGGNTLLAQTKDTLLFGDDKAYPPYSYLDENGEPSGFHVALIREVADVMDVPVKFDLGDWQERRQKLAKGKIDVLPMFYSPFRDLTFDFSEPHTIVYHEIFKRKEVPVVHDINDLKGRRVGIQEGAYVHDFVRNQKIKADYLLLESEEQVMRALINGEVDYVIVSEHLGRRMLNKQGGAITTTGTPVLPVMYTLAVRNGNIKLRNRIDEALVEVKEDGTFDELYDRWITRANVDSVWPTHEILKYAGWGLTILLGIGILAVGWIQVLRRQVRHRTAELQESLNEKTLLLSEVNHRVKNNLAVIHGLLTIQKDKVAVPECQTELEDSLSRIKSMSLVHNYAYAQEDLSNIDMRSYIMRLIKEMQSESQTSLNAIDFNIQVEKVYLSIEKAIPCGLILNELISNAIKHAFEGGDGGVINLSVYQSDEHIHIHVSDNGQGMPEQFDPFEAETTGFTIIKLLTRQLHAEWAVQSDEGTRVTMSFPNPNSYLEDEDSSQ